MENRDGTVAENCARIAHNRLFLLTTRAIKPSWSWPSQAKPSRAEPSQSEVATRKSTATTTKQGTTSTGITREKKKSTIRTTHVLTKPNTGSYRQARQQQRHDGITSPPVLSSSAPLPTHSSTDPPRSAGVVSVWGTLVAVAIVMHSTGVPVYRVSSFHGEQQHLPDQRLWTTGVGGQ